MLELVLGVLDKSVEEVLTDASLTLKLLKCYSKLYRNGALVKGCNDSLRKYYRQLQIDGEMKAKLLEDAKNRTCKPNWKGLMYVTKIHSHINPDLLGDQMAEMYLMNGILQESNFEILPKGYIEKKLSQNKPVAEPVINKEKIEQEIKEVKEIVKQVSKKKSKKTKK